jgi:hypothetical protein
VADKLCDICGEVVFGRFTRHVTCSYNTDPKELDFEDMIGGMLPDELD